MTWIMRFVSTEKRYLLVIHISVVIACVLLGALILADIRLNTLGEPFTDQLMAISIAISRQVYGIKGLVGLEQVLEILKQIPNVSHMNLGSIASYESYQLTINEALQRATLLHNINPSQIHAYVNDQAYLYYVILAFFLFGIKIQSLSYLWLLLFFISVLSFLFTYRKNIPGLLLLWCLLVAITLVVISNPGVGYQLITVYNYRFLPILGLIPLLHIVLSINGQQKSLIYWALIWIQMLILVFVLLARGSAQWMLIAIALSVIYSLWGKRRKLHTDENNPENISLTGTVTSRIAPLVLVLVIFLLAGSTMSKFLHEEYDEKLWARSHVVWHAAIIGMTTDPILMSRYACSDKPLTDQLMGFEQLQCDKTPRRYPRLFYGIFNQPSDMHGYQAAVRYLREHGSGEQIGAEIRKPGYFNIKWDRYGEIMRRVYFDMLRQNPVDSLYMFAIVKPLKYLKEAVMYTTYFGKGLLGARSTLGVMGILAVLFALHAYLLRGFRHLMTHVLTHLQDEGGVSPRIFLLIFISSLSPSILFYSQSHTIADSVAILIALGLSLQISMIKKVDTKRSTRCN